ncbi:MAG: HD domain-containing phosphohydrolase [Pseudomonadota bacterium]
MSVPDDALYISPEQLCVGLFVHLDIPWLDHPFSFNSFKIKNEAQIRTLRALKLKRIRYDPDRSDSAPYPHRPEPEAAPQDEAPAVPPDDPILAAKRQRIELLQQHRQELSRIEQAYLKAADAMRSINRKLQQNPVAVAEEANQLVAQMVEVFLSKADITLQAMGNSPDSAEIYFHSLNVSILCLMLARGLGLSAEDSHHLGMGALLHDMGLVEIPDRILRKIEPLTQAENNLRRMHCEYGVNMGVRMGLPQPVLRIIAQHHEMQDGSGFPKGLRGEAVDPLARIVAVVNHYDNLCNPIDVNKALTPHEALSQMFAQARNRFDSNTLQLLVRSLGVYPPGSIVRLSNETVGLVSSVNPRKPLRPWLVVYDPEVPANEAIMLDLEQETDINISAALRPSQLPPEIVEYLSPRKRVTYYFDGAGEKTNKP